ncbi:hypothetical protein SAMN05216227_103725 [Pseudorhodobacter antarcticus]|jgi:hypothetical protein|uniref:Uncharacterized protein n=1 Tax=Pseudorhodobacter antarcticus TaxID=1077947 RepID=A0A1H8L1E9_9RHOB|nr:hypothetical protein SAMN05216227_103725 [Pseudorhodobacter antarcticus]
MNQAAKLARLQKISDLILDTHLEKLRICAAARNVSIRGLQDLTVQPTIDDSLQFAQSRMRYEAWADTRRAELNIMLARQTADWLDEKHAAEKAFGRAQNISRLQKDP